MIEVRDVSRRFGRTTVLDRIGLTIAEGSLLALLGPSGCGKSTLLRLVAGLDRPDEGAIHFGGRDVTALNAAERNVAMVFQSYALYPHLTVAQNIALPLAMRRLGRFGRSPVGRLSGTVRRTRSEIRRAAEAAAEMLEVATLLDRKPGQLSGGQRQRVALARALVRAPSVFLLDEPLSNLDAKLRVQTRGEIVALHRRTGHTFVHVTHDQAEAMAMADRVAVMDGGRIAQCAPPREVYERPATAAVAAFVGVHPINLVTGPASGGAPEVFAAVAGPLPGGRITVGIRPEHLVPAEAGPVAGRLVGVEYQGAELVLDLAAAGGVRVRAVAPGDWPVPASGSLVRLAAAPSRVHVFAADTGIRLDRALGARAA